MKNPSQRVIYTAEEQKLIDLIAAGIQVHSLAVDPSTAFNTAEKFITERRKRKAKYVSSHPQNNPLNEQPT